MAPAAAFPPASGPPTRAQLEQLADQAAQRHGVPPALFKGLVTHESSWNPRAYRNEPAIQDGSRGLVQMLLKTARGEGFTGAPDELFDPRINLDLGAKHLAGLQRRFGSWPAALAAYNAGPRAGTPVTVPTDTVLARHQVTGVPIRTFTAQPGQYRNQPYVDTVLRHAAHYGFKVQTSAIPGRPLDGKPPAIILVAIGAAALIALAMSRRLL